jgi:3-isopropylmalate dehydrogenase
MVPDLKLLQKGLKVLEAVAKKFEFHLDLTHYNIGGENYKATGQVLSEDVIESLEKQMPFI